jgi:DNA-directed RNA polymerase III subunit RPC5
MEIDSKEPSIEPEAKRKAALAELNDGNENDRDPIIASYNVFVNPALASTRKILLLQHPHRPGPGSDANLPPSEVRIKPQSGMIEVDLPRSYADPGYDRDKGMKWGQALTKSMGAKSGGSHGLAGGFGVGVPPTRGGGGRRAANGDAAERDTYEWSEAVRRDQVLRTQTLGGMFRDGEECRWMVGVFKEGNLHLTPATSEIQLRSQLHHLDAATEQERLTRPRDGLGPASGAISGKDSGAQPGTGAPAAPKAIHMTIKSTGAGSEQLHTETMADRLRIVQMEPWQRLQYIGDEESEAWDTYEKTLFFRDSTTEPKGKENEKKLDADTVKLRTRWQETDFLRAVAGKDKAGVLEGYGSTAAGGVVKEDEDVEFIKSEEHDVSGANNVKDKGKGKAGAVVPAAAGATARRGTSSRAKVSRGSLSS